MVIEPGVRTVKGQGVIVQGTQISLAGDSRSTNEIKINPPPYIDFNEEAGSLLIDFGLIGEETLESDALALVSLSGHELAGIELLLDDKEVAKRLSERLRPSRYRK